MKYSVIIHKTYRLNREVKHVNKEYFLFDLDGTLTDPKEGITKSVSYSLNAFDIIVNDLDDLTKFIGPPLRESYKKYYSFSGEQAEYAVKKYREYFSVQGILENKIYDGISDMLKNIHQQGKKIVLATCKPTIYANRILKHFEIEKYFSFIAGSELDGERSTKGEVIEYALENLGKFSIEQAVMIGDREQDILGAKQFEMDSIGVLYGYGDYDELKNAGASHIVSNINELCNLIV